MDITDNSARAVCAPGYRILVINPGSTSTKVAVYVDRNEICTATIRHTPDELKPFKEIIDQFAFRKDLVVQWLRDNCIAFNFDAIVSRGGIVKPIPGGVYRVNRKMCYETYFAMRKHASNLGCLIANELAKMQDNVCQAYIADPVTVDEMLPEAHVSGSPLMPRVAIWHALNQRAIAREFARKQGKRYEDFNLIICHLGGGISVAAHEKGRAVDVNNAVDGEGPLSPERAGTLPAADLIHLCYSGRYTELQLKKRVAGQAGLMAHLGTTDIPKIIKHIEEGDEHARLMVNAMIFHTAKAIAAEGAVLKGKVDAILLTGGIAHCDYIVNGIIDRVSYLAPVRVFPGENEMETLAFNALAVLNGEVEAKDYE